MRVGLIVGALFGALVITATSLAAQSAPKTAADSMRAILRARAGAAVATPTASSPVAAKPAPRVPARTTRVVGAATVDPVRAQSATPPASTTSVVTPVAPSDTGSVTASVTASVLESLDPPVASPVDTDRATPPASPAPVPAAPAAPAAAPKPPTAAAPAAVRIAEVGFGTLKFDGLLQTWFGAGNTATASTFRIRRAEIKISGRISPVVAWTMMFDVSKPLSLSATTTNVSGTPVVSAASVNQSSRLMQDAILTLDASPRFHIDAGQFRLPLGNVGSSSSAILETIERPMFQADRARGGALGDVRDIGFVVRGPATSFADYWLGAFNGGGETQNSTDANNQKSLVGRITFKTPVNGLRVGASGLYSGVDSAGPMRKDRYGLELAFIRGAYLARVEMAHGTDAATDRNGGFVLVGYRPIRPLQVVARFDSWDPDAKRDDTAASVRATDLMVGATWALAGENAKVQVNLSQRRFAGDLLARTNQLLVNLQASW